MSYLDPQLLLSTTVPTYNIYLVVQPRVIAAGSNPPQSYPLSAQKTAEFPPVDRVDEAV